MKNLAEWQYGTPDEKRLLERCRDIVVSIEPGAEVILYGSYVRGEARSEDRRSSLMNEAEITLIRYRMDRAKEALSAARLMYDKDH